MTNFDESFNYFQDGYSFSPEEIEALTPDGYADVKFSLTGGEAVDYGDLTKTVRRRSIDNACLRNSIAHVRADEDANCHDVILAIIGYYSKLDRGYSTISYERISKLIKRSERTVRRYASQMISDGTIGRKPIGGNKFAIWVIVRRQDVKCRPDQWMTELVPSATIGRPKKQPAQPAEEPQNPPKHPDTQASGTFANEPYAQKKTRTRTTPYVVEIAK